MAGEPPRTPQVPCATAKTRKMFISLNLRPDLKALRVRGARTTGAPLRRRPARSSATAVSARRRGTPRLHGTGVLASHRRHSLRNVKRVQPSAHRRRQRRQNLASRWRVDAGLESARHLLDPAADQWYPLQL